MKKRWMLALGALAAGGAGYAYGRFEAGWVEVTEHEIEISGLPRAFDGYRIAHVSDFHIGRWLSPDALRVHFETVNALSPDLVAITGDVVSRPPRCSEEELVRLLGSLAATDGAVAVLGNHDHDAGPEMVLRVLRGAGIHALDNAVHTVRKGDDALHFAGVDDLIEGVPGMGRVLDALPDGGPAILLAHEADTAGEFAATGRFALQLSGHTHGGQVRLPFDGPVYLPEMGKKYVMGRYDVDGMPLYVNRGLGRVHLPVRFLCRPEIALLTLRGASGG
jgi:predicted MPP superfamily phosphohydrolase